MVLLAVMLSTGVGRRARAGVAARAVRHGVGRIVKSTLLVLGFLMVALIVAAIVGFGVTKRQDGRSETVRPVSWLA